MVRRADVIRWTQVFHLHLLLLRNDSKHFTDDKSLDYFLHTPVGASLSTRRIEAEPNRHMHKRCYLHHKNRTGRYNPYCPIV